MYGNASLEGRGYIYKAGKPLSSPQAIIDQMGMANKYANALIEIERRRWFEREDLLSARDGEVNRLTAERDRLDQAIKEARVAVKGRNIANRKRESTPEARTQIKELRESLKAVKEQLKDAKSTARARTDIKAAIKAIDVRVLTERNAAYGESPAYWGTKLEYGARVQAATKMAAKHGRPPDFRRWHGEGAVSVQISVNSPLSWAKAIGCKDSRLRIRVLPHDEIEVPEGCESPDPMSRRTAEEFKAVVSLCIDRKDGESVWADFPVRFERIPPDHAQIKWASLRLRKKDRRERWQFDLKIVSAVGFPREQADDGIAGINLGWRRLECGGMRIATLVGDGLTAGQKAANETFRKTQRIMPDGRRPAIPAGTVFASDDEVGLDGLPSSPAVHLCLSADLLSRWEKAESIQKIRDHHFNDVKRCLRDWLDGWDAEQMGPLPEWLIEQTETLVAWKNKGRLISLIGDPIECGRRQEAGRRVDAWRANRFEGDDEIFPVLEAWRKCDKHLADYANGTVDRAIAQRNALYRDFAAEVSRLYRRVHIEDIDYRDVIQRPDAEESDDAKYARLIRSWGSPGLLRSYLEEAVAIVERMPAKNITLDCHQCGMTNDFDATRRTQQMCGGCGVAWDQDVNAAINLKGMAPGSGRSEKEERQKKAQQTQARQEAVNGGDGKPKRKQRPRKAAGEQQVSQQPLGEQQTGEQRGGENHDTREDAA